MGVGDEKVSLGTYKRVLDKSEAAVCRSHLPLQKWGGKWSWNASCNNIVSGMVTRDTLLSYWPIFSPSLATVPEGFANVNSVQFPSPFLKWRIDHLSTFSKLPLHTFELQRWQQHEGNNLELVHALPPPTLLKTKKKNTSSECRGMAYLLVKYSPVSHATFIHFCCTDETRPIQESKRHTYWSRLADLQLIIRIKDFRWNVQ